MNNSEIVQYLANGYKVREIAEIANINRRTLEDRILDLRERHLCKTVTHLVANYLRKKMIE